MKSFFISLYEIVIHTPVWVYLLFAYLLVIGFKSTKTGIVPFAKILIIPIVFFFLSLEILITHFSIDGSTVGLWLLGLFIGSIVGYFLVCRTAIKVDRKNWLLELPGSWLTMILILLIFFSKYYCGYELSVDPNLASNTFKESSVLLLSSFCTGLFVGRVVFYLYALLCMPSTKLSEK